jgi:hypothetical protein
MSFGLLGYLAFGDNIQAIITLNLKANNPHDIKATLIQV